MKAFASARSLIQFLTLWHDQLSKFYADQLRLSANVAFAKTSIWEDDGLIEALSIILEASLTNGQILQLLIKFGNVLQADLPLKDTEEKARFLASGTIQHIILSSVRRNETMKELLPNVQQTHARCAAILENVDRGAKESSVLWKLLAVCDTLGIPLLEAAAAEKQSMFTFQSVESSIHTCIEQCIHSKLPLDLEVGIRALGYLGVLLTTLDLRHVALEPFMKQASPTLGLVESFVSDHKSRSKDGKATAFALVLSRFPIMLRYVDCCSLF